MIRWLSTDAVIAMHAEQIAEHGGSEGIRDEGLLESAMARPKHVHAYKPEADLAQLGASLAYGIAKNHPFIDGNKRTSLVAVRAFLLFNGYDVVATQADKYLTFIALAAGELSEEQLAEWLRKRLQPRNI